LFNVIIGCSKKEKKRKKEKKTKIKPKFLNQLSLHVLQFLSFQVHQILGWVLLPQN